jgi:TPR repeat protein
MVKTTAQLGNPFAQNYYGVLCSFQSRITTGSKHSGEDLQACKWYEKSANQNNVFGTCSLGNMILCQTYNVDIEYGLSLLNESKIQGNRHAMYLMCYFHLKELDNKNHTLFKWSVQLGQNKAVTKESILKNLIQSAEYHTKAQFRLGEYYYNNDNKKSEAWFDKSIEYDAENQYKYAKRYSSEFATNIKSDYKKARLYFEKSLSDELLDWDCSFTQYRLGEIYSRGLGIDKNQKIALKWFYASAENGDSRAQEIVGEYYLNEQDYEKAYHWFNKSIHCGRSIDQRVQQEQLLIKLLYFRLKMEKEIRRVIDIPEVIIELMVAYAISYHEIVV